LISLLLGTGIGYIIYMLFWIFYEIINWLAKLQIIYLTENAGESHEPFVFIIIRYWLTRRGNDVLLSMD
jgi:hypothetical protein